MANPALNKKVKAFLDSYLKGSDKNSAEYQHAIMLILKGALTDANFHSEAQQVDKYFPKAKKSKYVGTDMEGVIEDKGIAISKAAKWDGYEIIDAFVAYTKNNKLDSLKESFYSEFVSEFLKEVTHSHEYEDMSMMGEENVPTDPSKWSYYKSQAKKKFDVYPSAYANAWAAKQYKDAGGGWRTKKSEATAAEEDEFHTKLDKLVHKTFGKSSDEKNESVREDHSSDPNAKYVVRPCKNPNEPWAVWEGEVRVKGFATKEEAQAFADMKNKEQGLDEGMVEPRRGHNYYQLIKNAPVKYIESQSNPTGATGVLLHNKDGYIKGVKGAYIIDYFGAHFYVDLKSKVATSIYGLNDQRELRNAIQPVGMAPEHSDWKKYMREIPFRNESTLNEGLDLVEQIIFMIILAANVVDGSISKPIIKYFKNRREIKKIVKRVATNRDLVAAAKRKDDAKFYELLRDTLTDAEFDTLFKVGANYDKVQRGVARENMTEGVMSELDLMAKEAKDFNDFLKDVFSVPAYRKHKGKKDVMDFLSKFYKDARNESVNELNVKTYRSAVEKGLQRGDDKGKEIAKRAIDLMGNAIAKDLKGNSLIIRPTNVEEFNRRFGRGNGPATGQYEITFTGKAQLNQPDLNLDTKDITMFIQVELRQADEQGGWGGPLRIQRYIGGTKAMFQLSIRNGSVEMYPYGGTGGTVQFTRAGARLIAKMANDINLIMGGDGNVKHNAIKQFTPHKNESITEATEPEIISQLKDIVAKKQNQKLKDPKSGKRMAVDLYSASAVTQVYDALKQQKNKDKFVGLGLVGMVNMAFKLLKKESVNEAYVVMYAKNKGEKPAAAAYRDKDMALKFEKDLKKDGYITMVTQKKVKGVDESITEAKVKVGKETLNFSVSPMGQDKNGLVFILSSAADLDKRDEAGITDREIQTAIAKSLNKNFKKKVDFIIDNGYNGAGYAFKVDNYQLARTADFVVETKLNEEYYKSASEAADAARAYAEKKGYTIDEDDWQTQIAMGGKHNRLRPGKEKTHKFSIGLSKNGKPQKKMLHISLYGMPSGKYELTQYIN